MKNLIFTLILICFFYDAGAAKRIAFLEDPTASASQVGVIGALRDAGYTVDVIYPIPFTSTSFAGYDLVIVGRVVSSSDFEDYELWNSLDVPVFIIGAKITISAKMKLIDISELLAYQNGAVVDQSLVTMAVPIANTDGSYDQIFNGVSTGGAAFEFFGWFYDYFDVFASSFNPDQNTGKPLVALASNATVGAGTVVMVRWEANTAAFPGSGVHVNRRSFLNIGADDDIGAHFNFDNYKPASLKLFLHEVAFLTGSVNIGVKDLKNELEFQVFPNSSNDGNFTIKMKSEKSGMANVSIYAVTGQQVYNKTFDSAGNININSGLNKGMYLLDVNADGRKSTQKIVIR